MEKINKVRFRDLSVSDLFLKKELLEAVDRVLTHGQLLMGEEVELFEKKIADYCGTKYCVGVSSGTDAIYLALRSLDLKPTDEVITTPLSWIATLNAIHLAGAKPVFVDITEDLNLNIELIESAITPNTKVILPVHYTGRLCNMERIIQIAKKHNIFVVEDAAQAFGAMSNGKYAGSFGNLAAFSMNPMKVFPGYGEAGVVLTNDKTSFEKLLALRYLGTVNKEICYYPSLNAKIDTLQAAMMLVSFKNLEPNINRRNEIANYYTKALLNIVKCPENDFTLNSRCVFFDYTIMADSRDELKEYLESKGIETKIKHPLLMSNQPAYKFLHNQSFPVAEEAVKKILSLPIHEKLTIVEIEYVCNNIKYFYQNRS
jgi:dTDP-4-amino-4,6-dideoxygalactose transaminase